MVELGRVDICLEVSMMSSHLALPREGHLDELFHIFAYFKKYHCTEMVFDPSEPEIDKSSFERKDWTTSEFGHTLEEDMPPKMPQPRGLGFRMRARGGERERDKNQGGRETTANHLSLIHI